MSQFLESDRVDKESRWDDKQGLEQAVNICLEQDVDLSELERWSLQEDQLEKFRIFTAQLGKIKKYNVLFFVPSVSPCLCV